MFTIIFNQVKAECLTIKAILYYRFCDDGGRLRYIRITLTDRSIVFIVVIIDVIVSTDKTDL